LALFEADLKHSLLDEHKRQLGMPAEGDEVALPDEVLIQEKISAI
jgi:hypothetical protein